MKTPTRVVGLVSLVVLLSVLAAGLAMAAGPPHRPPGLDRAIAAQEAHTNALLTNPHVVGTAVGLAPDGQAVVKIYTKSVGARGLPAVLDGVPVEEEVTGDLVAQQTGIGRSSGTERFIVYRRLLYCTVGTLGALVKDKDRNVYALSNAHVYANEGSKTDGTVQTESNASNGDRILQPGRVDMKPTACGTDPQVEAATIGHLSAYQTIDFSRTGTNVIDAAIAKLSVQVPNATPSGGYGTPSSVVVAADENLLNDAAVQKYGRTTGLTRGTVTGINATVMIKYDTGRARFEGQIVVTGNGGSSFSAGGDSGSLIVTDPGKNPVALLFAGGSSTTIGNPIQAVLDGFFGRLGLSIVDANP